DGIRDDLVTGVQTCALPIYGMVWNFLEVRSTPDPDHRTRVRGNGLRRELLIETRERAHLVLENWKRVGFGRELRDVQRPRQRAVDRKSVVEGKRVGLGGGCT